MKNMSKKKATEFYKSFIGTAKGLREEEYSWNIETGGQMRYSAWVLDDRICVHCYLDGFCIKGMYFNLDTYEYDDDYMDKLNRESFYMSVMEQAEYWQEQIKKYLGGSDT